MALLFYKGKVTFCSFKINTCISKQLLHTIFHIERLQTNYMILLVLWSCYVCVEVSHHHYG